MAKYSKITSHVVPLVIDNIDTDQIIPARFLKVIDKLGLGANLFSDWRYAQDGAPKSEFVLNVASSQGAQVLLAGDNFGCGSSREHAPWALTDWGFRAVISTSFADIFSNNALKNGLLPVVVPASTHDKLRIAVASDPAARVSIDLENTRLTLPDGSAVSFSIDAFARHCLLNGIDELGYILAFEDRIKDYETRAA